MEQALNRALGYKGDDEDVAFLHIWETRLNLWAFRLEISILCAFGFIGFPKIWSHVSAHYSGKYVALLLLIQQYINWLVADLSLSAVWCLAAAIVG